MSIRRWLAALAAVVSLAVASPVVAQKDPKAKEALKAFEDGRTAYNVGEFDRAIELWKAGYQLKPDPIFLFNIAQAYRQKKDHERAIFFYKSYLREKPDAGNRAEIEARIQELQKILDDEKSAVDKDPTGTERPDSTVAPPPPPEETPPEETPEETEVDEPPASPNPGKGMRIAGLVTGGVGVALIVTGIVFSLQASSIQSDLEEHIASGMPWGPDQEDDEAAGKSAATLGVVTIGLGAAAVVGGGVLYFLGAGKDARARETAVIPSIGPRGAGVVVRWSF